MDFICKCTKPGPVQSHFYLLVPMLRSMHMWFIAKTTSGSTRVEGQMSAADIRDCRKAET